MIINLLRGFFRLFTPGRKCRYDYPDMSNFERRESRRLHDEDNSRAMSNALLIIVPTLIILLIKRCEADLSISHLMNLLSYMR